MRAEWARNWGQVLGREESGLLRPPYPFNPVPFHYPFLKFRIETKSLVVRMAASPLKTARETTKEAAVGALYWKCNEQTQLVEQVAAQIALCERRHRELMGKLIAATEMYVLLTEKQSVPGGSTNADPSASVASSSQPKKATTGRPPSLPSNSSAPFSVDRNLHSTAINNYVGSLHLATPGPNPSVADLETLIAHLESEAIVLSARKVTLSRTLVIEFQDLQQQLRKLQKEK